MKCIFCMSDSMEISFDKRDRPYYRCLMCRQLVFSRSPVTLRAVAGISSMLSRLNREEVLAFFRQANITFGEQCEKNTKLRSFVESNAGIMMPILKETQNV